MFRPVLRLVLWCSVIGLIALLALPLAYRVVDPPFSTPMLMRWVMGQRVEQRFTPLSSMTRGTVQALVAMEDARFCNHGGVDWRELKTALADEDGPSRGASTLTMQLARNLFLFNGGGTVMAALRKGVEIPLALYLDLVLPKARILELYLNFAELGPNGEFGIFAGSRAAFAKTPDELTDAQAALLIGTLANPQEFSARAPGEHARRRGAIALTRGREADLSCLK